MDGVLMTCCPQWISLTLVSSCLVFRQVHPAIVMHGYRQLTLVYSSHRLVHARTKRWPLRDTMLSLLSACQTTQQQAPVDEQLSFEFNDLTVPYSGTVIWQFILCVQMASFFTVFTTLSRYHVSVWSCIRGNFTI